MSTFLFDQLVFGPVQSRRLGTSLGVNLLPVGCKYCNFDCIYCECGWNADNKPTGHKLPSQQEIHQALASKLKTMQPPPDAITFAGNGEPTIHPDFAAIIDDTIALRNLYAHNAKVTVLSNATMLHKPEIVEALRKVDLPILKLDSAIEQTITLLNQPAQKVPVAKRIGQLQLFDGKCIIQTMFIRGIYNGITIDNTTPNELEAWEQAILTIKPQYIMIYSIARDTPAKGLLNVAKEDLLIIAQRIERHGIKVQISA